MQVEETTSLASTCLCEINPALDTFSRWNKRGWAARQGVERVRNYYLGRMSWSGGLEADWEERCPVCLQQTKLLHLESVCTEPAL